jgi:N-methylhydantoinase A/oxoprolinase/acetone carboxylase beta subunit
MGVRIGIDVGGTHTDAVILDGANRLVHAVKTSTTEDPTDGVLEALRLVLKESGIDRDEVAAVMFGTTHCANAIVERKGLARIGVIRIGKPATLGIKPMRSFPRNVREAVGNLWSIVSGGHEYDGRELTQLDEQELREAARRMKDNEVEAISICSVFSPVNQDHEKRAAEIVTKEVGEQIPVTLSYEIGSIGLLERESAAALNAAVVKIANRAINAFTKALREIGLIKASLYLTQNDGTLMSVDYARKYPIRTISSGPTNSIRGATFLAQEESCIVVDIGGTTTLVGASVRGFPRESAVAVEIGGVRTNFRMPDLVAISCGGGTVVRENGTIKIGPESTGYRLVEEGIAWGGSTLTATDVALAAGYAKIDDPRCDTRRLGHLNTELVRAAVEKIVSDVENAVDKVLTSPQPIPIVLVGGGGIILPPSHYDKFRGASQVIRPEHFQYANAMGAAIAQVSGEIDRIFVLDNQSRSSVIREAKEMAEKEAISAGAERGSVQIVEVDEVPLAYLPGNAARIRVKAVGKLSYQS